jgi:hypothetical protein
MADRDESVTVTSKLPPSAQVKLDEPSSPILDESVKEIISGEGNPDAARNERYKAMSPQERAKRRASIVTALERGVINDRMAIKLPDHMHGEWVRRDSVEIDAMRRLGFEVETQYGKENALNTDGSGSIIVHDVVFMTTSREQKELIDEVKQERAYNQANPKGPQKEEKEFAGLVRAGGDIRPETNSQTREVRRESIAAALNEMANQTQPQTLP